MRTLGGDIPRPSSRWLGKTLPLILLLLLALPAAASAGDPPPTLSSGLLDRPLAGASSARVSLAPRSVTLDLSRAGEGRDRYRVVSRRVVRAATEADGPGAWRFAAGGRSWRLAIGRGGAGVLELLGPGGAVERAVGLEADPIGGEGAAVIGDDGSR